MLTTKRTVFGLVAVLLALAVFAMLVWAQGIEVIAAPFVLIVAVAMTICYLAIDFRGANG